MPIKGSFIEWDDIMKIGKQRKDNGFKEDQLNELASLFKKAAQTYCSDYLKPFNMVNTCSDQ